MDDSNKKEFWSVMNVTMELCNRPPLSKEAVVVFWNILKKYEISTVRDALDSWVDSSSKAPTPHDILNLCKPVTPIYSAIERKHDKEANKQQAHKVAKLAHETFKPKSDMKAWAKTIIDNPKAYPDISLRYAREALGVVVDG
jgi:hypothetical protein